MFKASKILGLAAAMTMVAGAALSATFTADWTVDAHDAGPGLVIQTAPGSGNLSVELDVGESDTVDLFVIFTNETFVNFGEDTIAQDITVAFDFSAPDTMGNVTGETNGLFFFQTGVVTWDDEIELTFGSGNSGLFTIELNDAFFNDGFFGTNPGVQNGALISATLTYVTAAVPVPAAGLLLLTALGAGAALRRRKAVAA